MTLMSSISKLTTSVDQLTGEANMTKAELDAKVAQADAEVVPAQAEQAATEAARDAAGTHATDAETHLATVKAGVTYAGIDAILAAKAVTAVDVFVYDTSLDSDGDGGAWRHRCQHTSWYNEPLNTTTRGGRREFPAVAVIVATGGPAATVTIYDGDDPSLPMWMVTDWNVNIEELCVTARNGMVATGSRHSNENYAGNGFALMDFPNSRLRRSLKNSSSAAPWSPILDGFTSGSISEGAGVIHSREFELTDFRVNDVALTVRPDAPIDQATGLSVPTIAVATPGGVSVIKDDGTVQDLANVNAASRVDFDGVGNVTVVRDHTMGNGMKYVSSVAPPYSGSFIEQYNSFSGTQYGDLQFAVDAQQGRNSLIDHQSEGLLAVASDDGAGLIVRNLQAPNAGMVAMRNSKHTTGWMPGDIKGAFLSDTDDADLVSGELVTNGTFDTNTDWSGLTGDNNLQITGGQLVSAAPRDGSVYTAYHILTGVKNGQAIRLTIDVASVSAIAGPRIVGDLGILTYLGVGTHEVFGVATTDDPILGIQTRQTTEWALNSISVEVADADRSVNNNGLIVNGTVTRSPVATGADLVAYSGFRGGTGNYLNTFSNSLDGVAAGDFFFATWYNSSNGPGPQKRYIFRKGSGNPGITIFANYGDGYPVFRVGDGAVFGSLTGSRNMQTREWRHMVCLRRGNFLEIYVDGVLDVSTTWGGGDFSANGAEGTVGIRDAGTDNESLQSDSLALLRIGATAPTAEQIKRIYEDEKVIFQENAACTLYGTSDRVTALAHDPKTNLLHVGTSDGRSVFDGLKRVSNTETPVGTAISAVSGLIVEG